MANSQLKKCTLRHLVPVFRPPSTHFSYCGTLFELYKCVIYGYILSKYIMEVNEVIPKMCGLWLRINLRKQIHNIWKSMRSYQGAVSSLLEVSQATLK